MFTLKHWTHHLFGMLFAEGCLVRDIKHGDGALLTICKFGCATCKELLGTIQQNVYREQLRKKRKKKPAMHSTETMWTTYSSTGANQLCIRAAGQRIRWKQCRVKGRALLWQGWPFVLPVQVPVSVLCCVGGATLQTQTHPGISKHWQTNIFYVGFIESYILKVEKNKVHEWFNRGKAY